MLLSCHVRASEWIHKVQIHEVLISLLSLTQSMYQKCSEDRNIDLLLIGEVGTMFLSKILIHSCMIIHYITEGNIFVVIVYDLLQQQKNWNVILKITLNLMVKKESKCQKM